MNVTLTNASCTPDRGSVPAGAVTFHVTNEGGDRVFEVALVQVHRVLGEKESLTPGDSGDFSLVLVTGTYMLSCPGADMPATDFTVTPPPAPAPTGPRSVVGDLFGTGVDDLLATATTGYAAWVAGQVADLASGTDDLVAAVKAGDIERAKSSYGPARIPYERIEPVAESFGGLDHRIDGREDDSASLADFTGFHRLEQALWQTGSTAGMAPIADQLTADIRRLRDLVATTGYQPAQVANGAAELLDEIAQFKVTGEEERYSHLDLLDFQANLDGAREAYRYLRPALVRLDASLAATLDARFAATQVAIDAYREGQASWPIRPSARPTRELSRSRWTLWPSRSRRSRRSWWEVEAHGMTDRHEPRDPMLTRRRLLSSAVGIAGTSMFGALPMPALAESPAPSPAAGRPDVIVPFDGRHQAGIVTPAPDRLAFAAFDVTTPSRDELQGLLRTWTTAARRMTQGLPVGDVGGDMAAPPEDTGEALGLPAASLTVTFGLGPSLFDDRFGLASRRPAALADLPRLPGDALDPTLSDGDLCLQACAEDPQVSFHAVRDLARLGRGVVSVRWFQLGFGRTSSTSSAQATPRNLMGFKDGTNNIVAEDRDAVAAFVWVTDPDQSWMRDGTYLVARRIRMRIESWDRTSLGEQEAVFGRHKVTGAPLSGVAEHDTVNLAATDAGGAPLIPMGAHIRLAAPSGNGGVRILRRGYSFTDGVDPATGELEAGLFFICFQRDPASGFVALQRRLASSDLLNEYIRHTGSALFACPPGTTPDGWWAQALFA